MNPTIPASAMSQGGTFMRAGAVAWGHPGPTRQAPASQASPAAIEHALAAAIKDPDQVTDLLDALSRGRLWVPLPDARPVTDGSAGGRPNLALPCRARVPPLPPAGPLRRCGAPPLAPPA